MCSACVTRVMIFAIAAHRARPAGRLRRAGVVRPCGLHRASAPTRSASSASHGITDALVSLPVALGVVGAVRARDRRGLPAHQGRLLHHDHAGLRADGVLHRQLARRPMAATTACTICMPARTLRRLPDCWPTTARSTTSVSFRCLLRAYLLCRSLVASRFGRVLRGARENPAAHGDARLRGLPLSARRLRDRRHASAGLSGFLLANATDFVSAGLHVVAALGRAA